MRRHRCKLHNLLWDGAHPCQGCRADVLQEKLDKAKDQLLKMAGELKIYVGIGYPVNRILEPILRTLGFEHARYLPDDQWKLATKLGSGPFECYWLLPAPLAECLQEIHDKLQEELHGLKRNVIRTVLSVTEDVFEEKIGEFISAKLLRKELEDKFLKEKKP